MLTVQLLCLIASFTTPENTRSVVLKPLDFHEGEISAYLPAIHQIECDGKRLYFRGRSESHILITDLRGKTLLALGGKGGHPSEFGAAGVIAMSVNGATVSGIDKDLRFIRFYEGNRFHSYLALHSYNSRAAHNTSNVYAFSKNHVVVPALDGTHLAVAYHRRSLVQQTVGEMLDIGGVTENPVELNATLWCYREGFWYAAHKFFPLVTVFDENFERVNQFQIRHEATDAYLTYLSDFQPNGNFNRIQPLVSDFKWFRDSLFLMMQGGLFQVDPGNGDVKTVTHFYGKGADFGPAGGQRVNLPLFAFSEDGVLFAAHPALLWNHDFWYGQPVAAE